MAKKKLLVCGATGFLGRNVAEAFAATDLYDVHATYYSRTPTPNPKIKFLQADLTDRKRVNEVLDGMDIVLDYAALATNFKDVVQRPYIHTTDNIIMTSLVIRVAFEKKIEHVVFPSCGYLYNSKPEAFKETDVDYNNLPKQYFGAAWSKVYCEKMCEFYSGLGSTKFTVVRQANIYGTYDKLDMDTAHALPATIMKALASRDGQIEIWGDGSQPKDLIYVTDLTDLLKSVVAKKQNQFDFINAGSGEFVTMKQIAEKVVHASGKDIKLVYNTAKPSTSMSWKLDCTRAKDLFGWTPKVSIDDGIKLTYDWYRSVL